jgi:hypothetical protein
MVTGMPTLPLLQQMAPAPFGDNLTFSQASQHKGWREAMYDEMTSIKKNQTWNLIPLPPGKRAITSKWIYKIKQGQNGSQPKLKVRLIVRGFEQRYGVDFEETFAPVVKWSTIRALTTRATQLHHKIHHLNVKTAFLYGDLHGPTTRICQT